MRYSFRREIYFIETVLLLVYCSSSMLLLLPIYFKKIGISEISIGFLASTFYVFSLLSRSFIGSIVDRCDPKKVLFFGILSFSISVALYYFIRGETISLYLIRIFHGISLSAILLSVLLMSVIFSREENRASVLGLISVSFLLPNIFMPFLGEKIIEKLGFEYFFVSAFSLSAVTILFLFYIPGLKVREIEESGGFFKPLKKKGFPTILLLTALLGFGVSTVNTYTPLWAKEMRATVGVFFTTAAIFAVSIRVFLPGKLKIWGKMKLISISFAIFSVGIFLISLLYSNFIFSIAGAIYGIGMGFIYPNLLYMAVELVKNGSKGKALGIFTASTDLGFSIGPALSGIVLKSIGYPQMFKVLSLFVLFLFLLLRSGWKDE